MTGWARHTGLAMPLDVGNLDTDQLIPARFMSTPRTAGYGGFLLHDLRFGPDGAPVPGFALNETSGVSVLIARRNFGGGSSREAAVYALADFGIRAVIAPSFGDIFASNAVNNGLLPARVGAEAVEALFDALGSGPTEATIDLESCAVVILGQRVEFDLDATWRQKLINGWDDIDLTEQYRETIASYRARRAAAQPWAFPAGQSAG